MENALLVAVSWLRLGIEAAGAAVIALGAILTAARIARTPLASRPEFDGVRLTMGRYLALGLEFQLGADILSTAISPSWDRIGKLGAIAVLRTGLNYFLTRELRDQTPG